MSVDLARELTAAPGPATPSARTKFIRTRLMTLALVVGLLLLIEFASRMGWVSPLVLPAPTEVWGAMVDQWTGPRFWDDVWSTLSATVFGFIAAAAIAFAVSAVLVLIRGLEDVVMPIIIAIETMPKIAIAPIIILWLGFGQVGKVVIVVTVTFFPIVINTLQGLRVTSRDELDLLQSLGASRWQLFRYIRIPRSMPYAFAGLRVGAVFALIGAIVAEFVGSENGLGALILSARAQFNVPAAWALLVDLMVIGLIIYAVMWWLERRLLFWSKDLSEGL